MSEPVVVMAHDLPPLVDDRTVEARWTSAVETMAGQKRSVAVLIESVQREADEIEQSSKAAAQCGGKILRSRVWRFLCLQDIRNELERTQSGVRW